MLGVRIIRVAIAALIILLSACQVDVAVDLQVQEHGGGTVAVQAVFDEQASTTLGDLGDQLRVSDLARAGWDVDVSPGESGGVAVSASKAVSDRDQWQSVLDELAGPGVFTGVRVQAIDGFAQSQQSLVFDVDLSGGWDLFSDSGVADALNGEPFGAPIASLVGGQAIDDLVAIQVTGSVVSDADAAAAPASGSLAPRFDDEEPARFSATANTENSTAVLLRWIAYALFLLFALATMLAITGIVLQRRSDRLRPAPIPASLSSRVPGAASSAPASAPAPAEVRNKTEAVRLVIIEPLTVLYTQGQSVESALLAFVRDHRGTARADIILDGHRSLVAGTMDTPAFWELCGLGEDHGNFDQMFVEGRRLRSEAAGFLKEMQQRRIPVAATTNDAATWSSMARERDRLSAVWPWLASAEVGTTTASGAMFEVLRRESGVAHGHCLFVDSELASLDAAKELGMKTALFDTGDLDLPEIVGHPVVTDLTALFGTK